MALEKITPESVVAEKADVVKAASEILALAVYAHQHSDSLWQQYGKTWAGMDTAQKEASVREMAEASAVQITSQLVEWSVKFLDLFIAGILKDQTLSRLRQTRDALQSKLTQVDAQIEDLQK